MRNNFDGVRLVASLAVLVSHVFALSGRPESSILRDFTFGSAAVAAFFAISGYLVAGSWFADPSLPRFFARRALRLLPGLAVLCVVLGALAGSADGLRFMSNALAFNYWDGAFFPHNPRPEMDGSLWTIPVEARCYVLLAIGALILRRHLRWLALAACPLSLLSAQPLAVLGLAFLAGVVLYLFSRGRLILLAGIALALAAVELEAALRLSIALVAVSVGLLSWPGLRSAGRFGDLSYGVYLWAWPVTQLGVYLFGAALAPLFAWSVPVTLLLAWLSWHWIESPALRLKPKKAASPKASGELSATACAT